MYFAVFSQRWILTQLSRTLPACPLSTSSVTHPYCYTDMLTRPSVPLFTWPSTVWMCLPAQRSALSPLPMSDNRYRTTQAPWKTDLSIQTAISDTSLRVIVQLCFCHLYFPCSSEIELQMTYRNLFTVLEARFCCCCWKWCLEISCFLCLENLAYMWPWTTSCG